MREARDFAKDSDPILQRLGSLVRRMAISVTAKALWQLTGARQLDGTTETRTVEIFPGIGFYSRPPSSGSPEAIVNNTFDAKSPAIVATRDEKTRAKVAGNLAQDETMLFNSQVVVYLKANGTIEIRTAAGAANALALLSDLAALINIIANWTPVAGDGGAALKLALTNYQTANPGWPFGTAVLKGG